MTVVPTFAPMMMPGADQTGGNDDGGGGGLDQRRDEDTQKEGLDRVIRHLAHHALERAGGILLQRVAHEAHAV